MTSSFADHVDVRRQAGWFLQNQDDLEAWLEGHRQRVAANGDQVVLHPALAEFQQLMNNDPVVRSCRAVRGAGAKRKVNVDCW